MGRWSLILVVLACTTAAIVLAACGSGSSDPSKSEYSKSADAVCATLRKTRPAGLQGFAASHKRIAKTTDLSKTQKEELLMGGIIPPLKKVAAELDELPPPSGEEAEVNALLARFHRAIKGAEEDPASTFNGRDPWSGFAKAAKKYGLSACAEL
jgi:hypothetical protein